MKRRNDIIEVVEIPQDKKGKTLKKAIISVVLVIFSLVFLTVVGILIYLNSIGINYIETDNSKDKDKNNNSVLLEELLGEDGELLEDESNLIVGEEFDIIIEESSDLSGEGSSDTTTGEDDIITAVRDNSDLSASLYKWYNNGGAHMASKNVLNMLIVGIDATGGERMKGNSDVMMLASINKESGKITLCSFLRDSYSYFEDANGTGYYKKLTNAFLTGGADCLINAIEKNYKIEIDHFIAVDFEAFKQVIDLIGGVNLNLSKEESDMIKHTLDTTGANKYDVPYGENVVLNGEQALVYSRIRKLYSSGDVQRTQNQRKVINAIIKKSKTLSLSDLNDIVQKLGKYIYTDCSSAKLVSLGTSAILGKWFDFQVYSMDAPPESARAAYETSTSWLWVVDYPYSAQYVQKQIYGNSNIKIK